MEWWQILGLLAAGAFGVGQLAKSSAQQAITSSPNGLSAADLALLNQVFLAAMSSEKDLNILKKFSDKLHAAGFQSYGNSIDSKINNLSRFLVTATRTNIQMIPQIQTDSSGFTYSSTSKNPPVQT